MPTKYRRCRSPKITNSTFYDNSAKAHGGAILGDGYETNNVTFASNYAGGHGGALFGANSMALVVLRRWLPSRDRDWIKPTIALSLLGGLLNHYYRHAA